MRVTLRKYTATGMRGREIVKQAVPVFQTDIPDDGATTLYINGEPALEILPSVPKSA